MQIGPHSAQFWFRRILTGLDSFWSCHVTLIKEQSVCVMDFSNLVTSRITQTLVFSRQILYSFTVSNWMLNVKESYVMWTQITFRWYEWDSWILVPPFRGIEIKLAPTRLPLAWTYRPGQANVQLTLCDTVWKFHNFLAFRTYVKLILGILEVQNLPFQHI